MSRSLSTFGDLRIRNVRLEDAKRLLEIYAPYVSDTGISFESTIPTLSEFESRIQDVTANFPWLVATRGEQILGFAYGNTFRTRCAYEWSAESTIYLDREFQGRGVGGALYRELFSRMRSQGVVNVFAGVALPNDGSVALHERMGFERVGLFKGVGYKLERWWDVAWYQLVLDRPEKPQPLKEYFGSSDV